MLDVSDLRATIVPKSDQLNAEQLLGGPMTITVSDVRIGSGDDQPVTIHYHDDGGRPYKPCKTMRKVLILAWGHDGRQWVGKSMTLFNEPSVKFGGMDVGGIRISHLSDIPSDIKVALNSTKGKKAPHVIKLLQATGPALADVLAAIEGASNKSQMEAAKGLAAQLTRQADIAAAQDAYRQRVAQLKAAKPAPGAALADLLVRLEAATSVEAAGLELDAARDSLSAAEYKVAADAFDARWAAA